ncbi:MAG: AAA family ATPase [Candidatus Omnitrophica bacterium]|nr:AAA family ATPase [Candidatus Omnitrophota bacterium]
MLLKSLDMIGFKSFCEKTTLRFEPGITAIVGPNGCGKSNIFDSIRWVLGEQSAKALRGSQMQDVIFNGSDSKEPLSMAEVSLTFDNSQRYLAVDQPEITVTRRIFRSGESEYLLNKIPVRLKDILDLFAGTGIGAESYSLIQQGKIDLILSSRPEDRRLVFDEAAVITKYKAQKKEALRKLEETEQNLLRVNDIISEVKRQINSLERQANKARKYRETFEEIKKKELTLALLQKKEIQKQKEDINKQLNDLESQQLNLIKEIESHQANFRDSQRELEGLEEAILSAKHQIMQAENNLSKNKERIRLNQERFSELDKNRIYFEDQLKQLSNRIVSDEERLNNFRREYLNAKNDIEQKTNLLNKEESLLKELSNAIKDSLEAIAAAKKDMLDLVNSITNIKNEINEKKSQEQVFLARKKRLEIEKARIQTDKASTEQTLDLVAKEVNVLEATIKELNSSITDIKQEVENINLAIDEIDSDLDSLGRKLLILTSQKNFLEELKTKYEDISDSMDAVIYLDKIPPYSLSGLIVKIRNKLDLGQEDKRIVSSANLKLSGEAKPMDLDVDRLKQRMIDIEKDIEVLKNNRIEKERRLGELNALLTSKQKMLHDEEVKFANKKINYQAILEQLNRIKTEEEIVILEFSDTEGELHSTEDILSQLQKRLDEFQSEEKRIQEIILGQQNAISVNSAKKEEVLVNITRLKTEIDALHKSIASEETTLNNLENAYQQDKQELANFEVRIQEIDNRKIKLTEEIKGIEEEIVQDTKTIQCQQKYLKENEDNYKNISEEIALMNKRIEAAREDHDRIRTQIYQLQMQLKDIDFKYISMKERFAQIYSIDLDSTEESAFTLSQDIDIQSFTEDLKKLKERLESYGAVNLVAIEEYDELKKRYDFLSQQQTDLNNSKALLHEAINKINRTTKKMFLETFESIRQEFRNYFRLLFNGGDAQLFLIDEQDPLESGIEIICRPPGKKLQNVMLLSGGEKSLSAIALIFAIFKVKPAPFCVLDEIDAALDEANVARFSQVLQEFAKTSQFIVITHNKTTISNADVMYGITMEESGVSKIVSVKFAKDNQKDKDNPQKALVAVESV